MVVRCRIIPSASSLRKCWLKAHIRRLSKTNAISTCAIRGCRLNNFYCRSCATHITQAFWNRFHRVGAMMRDNVFQFIMMASRDATLFAITQRATHINWICETGDGKKRLLPPFAKVTSFPIEDFIPNLLSLDTFLLALDHTNEGRAFSSLLFSALSLFSSDGSCRSLLNDPLPVPVQLLTRRDSWRLCNVRRCKRSDTA